jgi:hypothetical protein
LPQPERAFNQTPRGIGQLLGHPRLNIDCGVGNKGEAVSGFRCGSKARFGKSASHFRSSSISGPFLSPPAVASGPEGEHCSGTVRLILARSPLWVTSRVAYRLCDSRRLRHPPDFCTCNDLSSARARLRHHAFVRGSSGSGISREVRGSMQRESLSSRFDMRGPSCQVVKTPELIVHPL